MEDTFLSSSAPSFVTAARGNVDGPVPSPWCMLSKQLFFIQQVLSPHLPQAPWSGTGDTAVNTTRIIINNIVQYIVLIHPWAFLLDTSMAMSKTQQALTLTMQPQRRWNATALHLSTWVPPSPQSLAQVAGSPNLGLGDSPSVPSTMASAPGSRGPVHTQPPAVRGCLKSQGGSPAR